MRATCCRASTLWDIHDPKKGRKDIAGHGTGVASLIAGHGHGPGNSQGVLGIAPKAKILPINVMNAEVPLAHHHGHPRRRHRVRGEQGAQVICVAISGSFSRRQEEAVDEAASRGALVIAASGNRWTVDLAASVTPPPTSSPSRSRPSAATTSFGNESITGPTMDLAAPGVDLTMARAGGGYWKSSGTSGATAIAAGAAALIRARYPNSGSNLFLNRLLLNATDRGEPGLDWDYGWGTST